MVNFKIPMLTFFIFTLVLGTTLRHFTIQIQNELKNTCVNQYINISLNMIILLGIFLTCISITSFICLLTCDCRSLNLKYLSFIPVIVFLTLIICGSVILYLVTGNNIVTDCYTDNIKSYATYITIFSTILFVISSYFLYKNTRKLNYSPNSSPNSSSNSSSNSSPNSSPNSSTPNSN